MVLSRPAVLRAAAQQLARPAARASFRSAGRQQPWQRITQSVSRRGYASSHGGSGESHAKSDLPWLIGSLAVGIPGTWWMLQPGEAHHEEHHEGKHEEPRQEEAPKEEPKEEPQTEAKEEPQEESKDESKEEAPKEEAPKEGSGSDSGVRFKGATNAGGDDKSAPDTRHTEPDAKGGEKKRIDSAYGKPLGAHESEGDASGSAKDKPSPSKEPLSQNQTSGKQQGISNTDTKHSVDVDNDPSKSKKPEGSVDTAKTKGPVDPNRPAV